MRTSSARTALGALLLTAAASAAPAASAQVGPTRDGAGEVRVVVDGDGPWTVRRDAADPSRVIADAPRGGALRGRVDAHALVRLAPGADPAELWRVLEVVAVREVSPELRLWRVLDGRGGDGLDLAARLAPSVGPGRPLLGAIPDFLVPHRAHAIEIPPDDPRYPGQWYLDRIDMEEAWHLSVGDPTTTIVVVDSGCDESHADLLPNLDPGRDVIDGDDDPTPPAGEPGNAHGTACAGLVAAATDNGEGIAGTCPECRLRCVRLLGGVASEVPISSDVEAFQFALDVEAAVVSNSWGFVEATPIPFVLRSIIESVVDTGRGGRGALVLFAAGNDDRELFDYEITAVRGVITVGAVNNFDEATSFSNRGASVDVVAPTGTLTTDITGTDGDDPGDYTSSFGGTSSACPVAAGVAGLLASAAPEASGVELHDALVETTQPSLFATPDEGGHDLVYGYGRIDPAAALRRVLGIADPDADAGVVDAGPGADGGPAMDAGATADPTSDDSGCGCRAIPTRRHPLTALLATAAVLLGLARRRRTRRR